MQITKKDTSPTSKTLIIVADPKELESLKNHTLQHFAAKVKIPGFRNGKAPLHVIEKNVDQNALQAELLDEAINHLYQKAVEKENLRPVNNPQISLKAYVPFSTLEFEAQVEIVGAVKLADYKKVKKTRKQEKVTTEDVQKVLESLSVRNAEKKPVERGAKKDDEVVISFKGTDAKGEPIKGADGNDYPLVLGSDTFIPGFEDNLIGVKPGENKEFTLTFPKDYGVKALANKKVTFAVTVSQVNELKPAKIDDEFASKVGPFKTVAELKADVKKQLQLERDNQADRELENDIIQEIVDKSSVELPETLIEEQIERLKTEVRQNLTYRGQTWQEMLEAEGTTDENYTKDFLRPEAERRVKTGLILAEVSIQEKLDISPEELEVRMQVLKSQYQDAAMQAELEKPEARRDIASRMLTEKTVQQLVDIATKK